MLTLFCFSSFVYLICLIKKLEASHFRGGTISWVAVNPYCTSATCQIAITTRFYYIYGRFACNSPSQIGSGNQLGDGYLITTLNGPYWSIQSNVFCDSFNIPFQWQAGERTQTVSVESGYAITARFTSW